MVLWFSHLTKNHNNYYCYCCHSCYCYHYHHYYYKFSCSTKQCNCMFHSWNIGPAHIISISTEVYFFLRYGNEQIAHQYHWLEKDLRVSRHKFLGVLLIVIITPCSVVHAQSLFLIAVLTLLKSLLSPFILKKAGMRVLAFHQCDWFSL